MSTLQRRNESAPENKRLTRANTPGQLTRSTATPSHRHDGTVWRTAGRALHYDRCVRPTRIYLPEQLNGDRRLELEGDLVQSLAATADFAEGVSAAL